MSTQVQYRRGTATQNNAFTGALAEITVDTTNLTLRVHDGINPGGSNIATVAYVDNAIGSLSANSIADGTSNVRIVTPNGNVAVSVGGNANVGVFTSSGLVVTGSIEATNGFIGLDATAIANGTANVRTFANANVTVSAGGTANVLIVTSTGANITGTLNATGNANVGNLGAATVAATTLTGTLSTAAQTNITSVGTLSSLSVTGNITGGNLVTTGTVQTSNLIVSGIESVGTLNVSGDTLISGNLTVSGTTLTANVQSLVVSDPILGLGRGANGDPLVSNDGLDRGIEMFYYTTAERIAFMGYDNSEGKMLSAANVSIANNVVTVNSLGTTVVGTLESTVTTATGNITGGNLITAGLVSLASITKSGSNGVGNIGQSNNTFNTVFAKATSAQYADLAELYTADATYESGTVLVFGGAAEVTESSESHSVRIAGVVSTNPAHVMNSSLTAEHTAVVALVGRVPCRVVGQIHRGDCLVSSDVPGVATALDAVRYQPGAVIGKALEDYNSIEAGVIEVVVGRL
jgi:hypothetical protein